jgi:hypothetical protein
MVRFGGIPATSFKIVSDTEILAIVGSGASGTVMIQSRDIYVEKPGFKMYTPPPIDSLFTIGQTYQGGIIFYIDSTLIHGLIAAPYNQSNGIIWWSDTTRTYADGRAIGTGMANTKKVVALFGDGLYAAKICDDLILNGYDDWFLPSQLELTELAKKNFLIGGFTDGWYWSSTDLGGEPHAFYAFNTHFPDGFVKLNTDMNKPSLNLVRAIRAF